MPLSPLLGPAMPSAAITVWRAGALRDDNTADLGLQPALRDPPGRSEAGGM